MAFTQTDLDSLDAAYKSGAQEVRFQDRSETFRSIDEYLQLRGLILEDVNPTRIVNRQIRMITSSGI